jgi:gamma-glutamyltranspeptidase/glutathione hydrolase
MVVNNLRGEEDIHPRGFHQDPPGAPLATMMAPTILRRNGDRLVVGSGGSNRLRTAILQVLVGIVEQGLTPEVAVPMPRLHLENGRAGPHIAFERPGLDSDVARALCDAYPAGPRVFDALNLYFGGVHVASRIGGALGGAGDPRRGGAVRIAGPLRNRP